MNNKQTMATFLTLKQHNQIEQRTADWYKRRKQLVTASEAASVLPNRSEVVNQYMLDFPTAYKPKGAYCNPYCSKKEWFLRKTDPRYKFTGNEATEYGQRYEPIAQALYEAMKNTVVHEYGLIVSNVYDFIGASPDGVSEENVMLEIKCPFVREITGVPPIYYYIQMQVQMEVCDLPECDYLECKFLEFPDRAMYLQGASEDENFRGCYIRNMKDIRKCKYPPRELMTDPVAQDSWCMENLGDQDSEEYQENVVVRWRLQKHFITPVYRRQEWFRSVAVPYLEQAVRVLKKPYIYRIFQEPPAIEGEDCCEEVDVLGVKNEIDFSSGTKRKSEEIDEALDDLDDLPDIC